jgi:hypothetical protein
LSCITKLGVVHCQSPPAIFGVFPSALVRIEVFLSLGYANAETAAYIIVAISKTRLDDKEEGQGI